MKKNARFRKKAETVGSLSKKYINSGMACIRLPASAVAVLASVRNVAWSKPMVWVGVTWAGAMGGCERAGIIRRSPSTKHTIDPHYWTDSRITYPGSAP